MEVAGNLAGVVALRGNDSGRGYGRSSAVAGDHHNCGVGSDVSMIEVPIDPKQKVKRAPHPARTHDNPRGTSASSSKAGPHTPTVKDR